MPIHNWSLVFDRAFHDFHHVWIGELRNVLNGGILPPDYYAMAEKVAGRTVPDVLTLQTSDNMLNGLSGDSVSGATAVATAPHHAVSTCAASVSPKSSIAWSRKTCLRILPVTVRGSDSTIMTY
jgi:hypothetical protein